MKFIIDYPEFGIASGKIKIVSDLNKIFIIYPQNFIDAVFVFDESFSPKTTVIVDEYTLYNYHVKLKGYADVAEYYERNFKVVNNFLLLYKDDFSPEFRLWLDHNKISWKENGIATYILSRKPK